MRNLLDAIWPTDGSIKTLLDLGCGDLWFTAGLPGVETHVGIDLFDQYLEEAYRKQAPGFTGINRDIREFLKECPKKAYDAVLAIDVIEHFEEPQGLWILSQMERVAAKLVIVWTTLGFIEQGPYDNNGVYNLYQEHKWGPAVDSFPATWSVDIYPDWHSARGGGIFAYRFK